MRIALIHDRVGGQAGGGGGVRLMIELAVELQGMGHEVSVFCHDHDPATAPDIASSLNISSVRSGPFSPPATRPELLRRQWIGMRQVADLVPGTVEVINAHEWPASRAGARAARRTGAPFVWTRNDDTAFERGLIPESTLFERPSLVGRAARVLAGVPDLFDARTAAGIVVLDTRNANAVGRAYRRSSRILRCGPSEHFFAPPDRDQARSRVGAQQGTFLVVAVGILFPHRRFEDLVEAVGMVGEEHRLDVRIIGSDHADPEYAERLAGLIAASPAAGFIRLIRQAIPEEQLRDLYAAADVTVFPNRRQAYGLAPLESLASGTPVVVSTGIGVSEVIAGRPGVFVVAPERPAELAEALRRAMNPEARSAAANTREWLRSSLGNRQYAEAMLAVYESARSRR